MQHGASRNGSNPSVNFPFLVKLDRSSHTGRRTTSAQSVRHVGCGSIFTKTEKMLNQMKFLVATQKMYSKKILQNTPSSLTKTFA